MARLHYLLNRYDYNIHFFYLIKEFINKHFDKLENLLFWHKEKIPHFYSCSIIPYCSIKEYLSSPLSYIIS